MKILFIGCIQFSEQMLKKVLEIDGNIVGVVTRRKSPFNSDFVDLSNVATQFRIPVHHTENINSSLTADWISEKEPDVIFCFGWSQLLSKHILDIPKKGVVGYHPAELPKNRGRHPLIWALVLGLETTASTFFLMDEGADTGGIISQETFQLKREDYAVDAYERMTRVATFQIEGILHDFENDSIEIFPQNLSDGNSWRKRGMSDGKIDFRMSTESIYNLVRALSKPYVGAHLMYKGTEKKVWRTEPGACSQKNLEPGKIIETENHKILIKTGDGAIWLTDHELSPLPSVNEYIRYE